MLNTLVSTFYFHNWQQSSQFGIVYFVHNHTTIVFHIALEQQTRLVDIIQITGIYCSILQLINQVTFKLISTLNVVRILVFLLVVLNLWAIGIQEFQNQLLLQFLNINIRRIGTIQNFEIVVKQCLSFVRSDFQQVQRTRCTTTGSSCPNHTHCNSLYLSRTQGERACGLQESAISGSVTCNFLCPRLLSVGRVSIAREHIFGWLRTTESCSTVGHILSAQPFTLQQIVIFNRLTRVTTNGVTVVVVVHVVAQSQLIAR